MMAIKSLKALKIFSFEQKQETDQQPPQRQCSRWMKQTQMISTVLKAKALREAFIWRTVTYSCCSVYLQLQFTQTDKHVKIKSRLSLVPRTNKAHFHPLESCAICHRRRSVWQAINVLRFKCVRTLGGSFAAAVILYSIVMWFVWIEFFKTIHCNKGSLSLNTNLLDPYFYFLEFHGRMWKQMPEFLLHDFKLGCFFFWLVFF